MATHYRKGCTGAEMPYMRLPVDVTGYVGPIVYQHGAYIPTDRLSVSRRHTLRTIPSTLYVYSCHLQL